MKLILRPLIPPCSFSILKYAASDLPIVPYADAGPLYGLVCPIFISVSVAPGSYFCWAWTAEAATRAVATSEMIDRNVMVSSRFLMVRVRPGRPPASRANRLPRWRQNGQAIRLHKGDELRRRNASVPGCPVNWVNQFWLKLPRLDGGRFVFSNAMKDIVLKALYAGISSPTREAA